jgi:pimeloyl-ACP methyl ester carboxylesterase
VDADPAPPPRRRRSRAARIIGWIAASLGILLIVAVIGIVIYSQVGVMAAEPEPLAAVKADPAIAITDDSAAIVLAPVEGETGDGLVFIPGAKVDPWAYAAKLSGIVESGTTVVITKPWLNLAFFDLRPLDAFTSLAPDVDTWAVGGHSLGGVPACQLTESAQALILFASYCANDLSTSGLPVLSLAGELDGLSTPEKIADARPLLPAGADMVEIAGAAHSSFGDYGPQPGDGTPTISDADMTETLTSEVDRFLQTQVAGG